MIYSLVSLTLLLTTFSASAQPRFGPSLDPRTAFNQYALESWGVDEGLPRGALFDIVQDGQGYLWLASNDGLARFDGMHFAIFDRAKVAGFLNNAARVVLATRAGAVWVGFERGGLHRLQADGWLHLTAEQGLLDDSVLALHESTNGDIWIGTRNGLQRVSSGVLEECEPQVGCPGGEILQIASSADGALLVLTDQTLNVQKDSAWQVLASAAGHNERRWVDFTTHRNGDRLLAAESGRLYRFEGDDGASIEQVAAVEKLPAAVFKNRAGTRYVGTWGDGITRYTDTYASGETLDLLDGLPDNRVISILEDREGNLWLGTYDGLVRLKNSRFFIIDTRMGLPAPTVYSAYEEQSGEKWLSMDDGVVKLERSGVTQYTVGSSDRVQVQVTYQDRDGRFWFGTDKGLLQLNQDRLAPIAGLPELDGVNVRSLLQPRNSTKIWIARFSGGLLSIEPGADPSVLTRHASPDRVVALFEDRGGEIWLGASDGLYRMENEGPKQFMAETGPVSDYVRSIYEDDRGILWLGTVGSGLLRLEGSRITAATQSEGLFDDDVWHLLEDDRGLLWMCSDNGIFNASIEQLDQFAAGDRKTIDSTGYGVGDGIRDVECNGGAQPGAFKDGDGAIWFPTMGGVVVVEPKTAPDNPLPPPVVIEQVLADESPLATNATISISPDVRQLEFHFAALSLTDPAKVRFRYQLQGFDRDWSRITDRRVALYAKPPPGRYEFRVLASNNDGLWNESGDSITIVVPARFYETPGFRISMLLAAALLIIAAHRLRVRALKRQRAQLKQQVAERTSELSAANAELEAFAFSVTHDLRSPLQAISGFADLALDMSPDRLDSQVKRCLEEIERGSEKMSDLIDDLMRFFRLSKQPLRFETVALGPMVKEVLHDLDHLMADREVQVDVSELGDCRATPALLKQVFANLIANALKFSRDQNPARISVFCRDAGGETVYGVSDNGVGFDPEKSEGLFELFHRLHGSSQFEGTGIGLALVKQIVERHRGRIWAESSPGQGATFFFTLGREVPETRS